MGSRCGSKKPQSKCKDRCSHQCNICFGPPPTRPWSAQNAEEESPSNVRGRRPTTKAASDRSLHRRPRRLANHGHRTLEPALPQIDPANISKVGKPARKGHRTLPKIDLAVSRPLIPPAESRVPLYGPMQLPHTVSHLLAFTPKQTGRAWRTPTSAWQTLYLADAVDRADPGPLGWQLPTSVNAVLA